MGKRVVIVGGVAGGATAAARLRRLDESLEIVIYEKGEYVSFANCGLPYHIGEVIKEREALLVTTKEALYDRFRIEVRNNSEVIAVDTDNKKVRVKDKDREYEDSYDYLVLSPGASPFKPPIPGIMSERVLSLRNVPDTDKIKGLVDGGIKKAAVIGGGFIGIEVAENLKERGIDVTLIEAAPHILAPLDTEISMIAEKEMRDKGVNLIINDGVEKFTDLDKGIKVSLKSGHEVNADIVIAAIGVKADTAFLKDTKIELNERGYIKTNSRMETTVKDVYAAGDATEIIDYVTKTKASIALAGPANRQGRIIADNICGLNKEYRGALGTSIIKIFDLTAASTGNNERQLKSKGIKSRSFFVHPQSHASYYPGAFQMTIKVITDEDGKILGAQAIGYDGVDKIIDVLATVIKFNGNYKDLAELDLAYAPPYSSAKSPANVAGFVIENAFQGLVENKTFNEYKEEFNDGEDILLDVREVEEFENGIIKGAINIPLNSLRSRLGELAKDKRIWIYCQIGLRGYIASRILNQNGYKTYNLIGGYRLLSLGKAIDDSFNKENIYTSGNNNYPSINKIEDKDKLSESIKVSDVALDKDLETVKVDACGLACPGPLLKVKESVDKIEAGQLLEITASDPGFYEDVQSWARRTNNEVVEVKKEKGEVKALLRKKAPENRANENLSPCNSLNNSKSCEEVNKTIVVFSGDLDKAIASFIIANGARAMGGKVTMFFTFWGINILRKEVAPKVEKTFLEKAFSFMMPRGSKRLSLSKMNMMGIGPKMIKGIMEKQNVDSLEELIRKAIDSGVEIVACQMSMDLLGIKMEELIDGVKQGGVGYYMGNAEEAGVNLFI